jgi:hypothetical protein
MGAKDIVLKPISAQEGNAVVKAHHYSGKVVTNSQIHIGVYYNGKLEGAMQFGPSLDKRKIQPLVKDTGWNEFIELNRMAFSDALPRNSESRALAIAMKLLRKHAPHLKWVVSFADGTQCGDGTIYRASGFLLTGLKRNTTVWLGPEMARSDLPKYLRDAYDAYIRRHGRVFHQMTLQGGERHSQEQTQLREAYFRHTGGSASRSTFDDLGCQQIPGYQFRYVYFLQPECRALLTCPVIPFDDIPDECRMYKGVRLKDSSEPTGDQPGEGGAAPTRTLHTKPQVRQ